MKTPYYKYYYGRWIAVGYLIETKENGSTKHNKRVTKDRKNSLR